MAINELVPADSDMVSTLASRDREERVQINLLWAALAGLGAVASYTEYNCSGGQTSIAMSALANVGVEVVRITGAGVAALEQITGGSGGQIKVFFMDDANITFVNLAANFDLNQAPGEPDYGGHQYDILTLVNIGGDPGTLVNGTWFELFRTSNAR